MRFRRSKGGPDRPWRLSAKLLIACSIATVLGFSAICASVLLDMRSGEEKLAQQSLENLATGIDADGRFAGVVTGSIRFTYFHELFGRLQLGDGDTICVLRRDRTVIMRRPFDLDVIGRKLGDMPRGATPALFQNDAFSGLGPVDDVPRLYVRGPSTSPLFVVVGKPLSDILDLWRTEAI